MLDLNAQTVRSLSDQIQRSERVLVHMIDEVKMFQNNSERRIDEMFEQIRRLEPQVAKVEREAYNRFTFLDGKITAESNKKTQPPKDSKLEARGKQLSEEVEKLVYENSAKIKKLDQIQQNMATVNQLYAFGQRMAVQEQQEYKLREDLEKLAIMVRDTQEMVSYCNSNMQKLALGNREQKFDAQSASSHNTKMEDKLAEVVTQVNHDLATDILIKMQHIQGKMEDEIKQIKASGQQ